MSAKKNRTTFNKSYTEQFPFIQSSRKGGSYAFCSTCACDFSILHRGKGDILKHIQTDKHQRNSNILLSNKKIDLKVNDDQSVIRAEALFTSYLIEHNIAINASDHAGPLFRRMFPDSEIARKYGCARTKTSAIVKEMAKSEKESIVEILKRSPFSIATDGSNKTDCKLYPICVTYYNEELLHIETSLLCSPVLSSDGTGVNIANLLLTALSECNIDVNNCLALGADNAPVMIGKKAGVAGILTTKIPDLCIIGCPCHLLHLAAEKGAAVLPVSIEEYIIDIFFFLDKSSKRKEKLKQFQKLHDTEVRKLFKHVSTRWLSLGRSLNRLLEQWEPLLSFFKEELKTQHGKCNALKDYRIPKKDNSEAGTSKVSSTGAKKRSINCELNSSNSKKFKLSKDFNDTLSKSVLSREERVFMFLSNDVSKSYCYFLAHCLPIFEEPNIQLQSSSPQIHLLHDLLYSTLRNVMIRFVTPTAIKMCTSLLDVKYHCKENQKLDSDLIIGQSSSKIVNTLKLEEKEEFFQAVRNYFTTVCDYMIHKFPFKDDILLNAKVLNLNGIENASFSNIRFFCNRFPVLTKLFNFENTDALLDELEIQFSSLQLEDLPVDVLSESRMDVKWAKVANCSNRKYNLLCKFVLSLFTLPHSNASCERVFSVVTKTQTQFRSQLSSEHLEDLLTVKSSMRASCFEQKFSDTFLKKAKSSTYNSLKQ
nr:uncharacterized protein LOC122273560 [Parasteatoda tepidariorum]